MKTTAYICDICKQSKSEDELKTIEVKTDKMLIKDVDRWNTLKIDICPNCLRKKGFIVEIGNDEEIEAIESQNRKTIENKLFDILEDMGVAFVE